MMKKIKIVNIVGARPNFMKIAPLFKAYKKNKHIVPVLVHTNQHSDKKMSETFFKSLGIPKPDYIFSLDATSVVSAIAQIMVQLEKTLAQEKPDLLVVVGDVNSTLAAAITANKMGIKVAHVEAGLRSADRKMPEEINRIIVDHISDMLFVTEKSGLAHLKKEGVDSSKIFYTGNVMIDNLIQMLPQVEKARVLNELGILPKQYIVMTMHRPSNVDSKQGLMRIISILKAVLTETGVNIVLPIHPRTRASLEKHGLLPTLQNNSQLILSEPLDYIPFIKLVKESLFVVTDSGGIQEEAAFLRIPTITLRDSTERPSTVHCGANIICPPGNIRLLTAALRKVEKLNRKKIRKIPLSDGKASERIVSRIVSSFAKK